MAVKILSFSQDKRLIGSLTSYFKGLNHYEYLNILREDEIESNILTFTPDFVLLDCDQYGAKDILRNCKNIINNRKSYKFSILMISNKYRDRSSIIAGLSVGADEYFIKPVDMELFFAKLRAILRRATINKAPENIISHKSIKMNLTYRKLYVNNKEIALTPKEFALLYVLISDKDNVIKREVLMERVWGQEYLGDPRTINKHIETLRKKMGSPTKKHIVTVEGSGYKYQS